MSQQQYLLSEERVRQQQQSWNETMMTSQTFGAENSTPTTSHTSLESKDDVVSHQSTASKPLIAIPSYGAVTTAVSPHKSRNGKTSSQHSNSILSKIRNTIFGHQSKPPKDDKNRYVEETIDRTQHATTVSWRIATFLSVVVAIVAAFRVKPVYRFYEDRMPEWIWDRNVYISRDSSGSNNDAASNYLIAQLTENLAMRQFTEVSNRPNRAYARQWQMDYTEYYAGRVAYSVKSCFDKAYVLHTLAQKQRDEARDPPPRWPQSPRVRYDAIVLLPSDAIVTDMDGDIVNALLPRDKLVAIAGWTNSLEKLSSRTGIVLFNLEHKHAMKVADLWWKYTQEPHQSCGAANGISSLIDAIASIMDQEAGETLDDLIQPLSEKSNGAVGDNVVKCLPSSVPGARSELFLSNQQQHVETIHQTADSVCYRFYPKCEVVV